MIALTAALVLVLWSLKRSRADDPARWPNEEDGFDAWLAATFDGPSIRR